MRRSLLIVCSAGLSAPALARQFVNGDFSSGTLDEWAVTNTGNGVGAPGSVTTVDIDGPGPLSASPAARFSVGQVVAIPAAQEGVVMTQDIRLDAGVAYQITLDWMARNGFVSSASDCGVFAIVVDGIPLTSAAAGALLGQTSGYGHLSATFAPPQGRRYSIGVRITRSFMAAAQITQHVDNLAINVTTSACYANCDESTGTPRLTANDFQCFITRFAAGDAWANCDGSVAPPPLTPNDFICFVNRYAKGNPWANCDGSTGEPLLTGNDFLCFINRYATGDPYANCDGSGLLPVLNGNDYVCFINAYAAGCS